MPTCDVGGMSAIASERAEFRHSATGTRAVPNDPQPQRGIGKYRFAAEKSLSIICPRTRMSLFLLCHRQIL
jgi:hypothetical protein